MIEVNLAFRRHACESCGAVFICDECSDAMVEQVLSKPSHEFPSTALYSKDHFPHRSAGVVTSWLCPQCTGKHSLVEVKAEAFRRDRNARYQQKYYLANKERIKREHRERYARQKGEQ